MSCWLEHGETWKRLSIIGPMSIQYVDPLCSDRHPIIIPALSLFICHQTRSNCVAQSRCVIQHLYTAMLFHLNDLSFPSCTVPFPLSSHSHSFCPSLSVYLMPSSRFWLPSCCPLPFSSCFFFMWYFCLFTVSITFFQVCLTIIDFFPF